MEPFGRQPPRFVPTLTDVVPQGLPLQKPARVQEPVWTELGEAGGAVPDAAQDVSLSPAAQDFKADANVLNATAVEPVMAVDLQRDPVLLGEAARWQVEDAAPDVHEVPLNLDLPEPDTTPAGAWDAVALHEMLVERILARVQPQLEAHLREVVADVVSMHAQAMARSLHGAVEDAIQRTVADAIAHEQIQADLGLNSQF